DRHRPRRARLHAGRAGDRGDHQPAAPGAPVVAATAPDLPADVLLDVKDLAVAYRRNGREVRLVENVSFQVGRGEALGLAGESGCGKTTTALAPPAPCTG